MSTNTLDRYKRQVIFPGVGPAGQARLATASVLVAGCGATGSMIATLLARMGAGRLRLVDRDYVELHNLQRQVLFDEADVQSGLPKAVAAADKLRRINSDIQVEAVVADIRPDNVLELMQGVQLVMDGTDNFDTRYLLNDACLKLSIPWIYTGVIASHGATMDILPGGPCLRCLYPKTPPPGSLPTCDTAGILGSTVATIGGVAATEAIKLLVGQGSLNLGLLYIDVWINSWDQFEITRRPDCPACALGNYEFLQAQVGAYTTALCGRNAVQVSVPGAPDLNLDRLAERLGAAGQVQHNPYLVRLTVADYEITIFSDARAIIKGTEDETVARSLYARYVGV